MNKKLWLKLFWRITAVFAVFVIVIAVANSTLLLNFFSFKQKNHLVQQFSVMKNLDYSDSEAITEAMSAISENYSFEVEVYSARTGGVIYTTKGSQMLDFYHQGSFNFSMIHSPLLVSESQTLQDCVFEKGTDRVSGKEYLVCRGAVHGGSMMAELRIPMELLRTSADTANEFMVIISLICFAVALVWVFFFARRFTKPIMQMNEITKDMAALKFDRRLNIKGEDEIGSLAQSINNMSDSLSNAMDELRGEIEMERRVDAMRRGFVANVSHELKTPLSIISGYAEGLKMNINESARKQYCDTIIDESMRMSRLVHSILDLSRYESGQAPMKKEDFDLSIMAAQMVERIFTDSGITAVSTVAENTFICADPVQTEQILKAYLENALAHTPSGGNVSLYAKEQGNALKICVENTGSHIDPEIMPKIWQSFYRGDTSHKRERSRFGLGLSIVSSIIKNAGQQCGVYNNESGVVFWFTAEKTS